MVPTRFLAFAVQSLSLVSVLAILQLGCGRGPTQPTPTPTPAPLVITSVQPNTAPSGVDVAIFGSGFRAGASVTLGGADGEVRAVSSNAITVRTPERGPGRVDVVITNPDGERATLAGGFTLTPFRIDSAVPVRGYGQMTFTILGSGFVEGVRVYYDGLPAPFLTVPKGTPLPDGSIIVGLMPAHDPGRVDLTVTHPGGKSLTLPNAITYVPPPVLTASPMTVAAGSPLTLSWVADPIASIDYIALYREGVPYNEGVYELNLHVTATSGTITRSGPLHPGRYEFRYLPSEGQWGAVAARSSVVTVTPASLSNSYVIAVSRCAFGPPRPRCALTPSAGIAWR